MPAAAVLTTTRLTAAPADAALEHQQREYAVELARTTIDLGKLAQPNEMTPLSRLVNSITVEQMVAHKKGDAAVVYEVREDEPVINAIELMCEKRIGSVIVRGRETQLHVGMMSRIDCMRNLVLKNQFARETPISRVMDKTVPFAHALYTTASLPTMMRLRSSIPFLFLAFCRSRVSLPRSLWGNASRSWPRDPTCGTCRWCPTSVFAPLLTAGAAALSHRLVCCLRVTVWQVIGRTTTRG